MNKEKQVLCRGLESKGIRQKVCSGMNGDYLLPTRSASKGLSLFWQEVPPLLALRAGTNPDPLAVSFGLLGADAVLLDLAVQGTEANAECFRRFALVGVVAK